MLATAVAFVPTVTRSTKSSSLSMQLDMPGALPPVGFFDPLGLSEGKTPEELKKFREAELKHGRLAMLASLGFITAENFHPLFNSAIEGPAIYHFQAADDIIPYFWVAVLFGVGLVEGQNILVGWETPAGSTISTLKEDYVNGDLDFDPLGLKPDTEEEFDIMRTKELQNGRLAMLGIAGMVAQELVDGKDILHF